MPYTNLIANIETTLNNIRNLDIEQGLQGNLQPWNNLDKDDLRNSYNEVTDILTKAVEQEHLSKYPHNILNSLSSSLNTLFTHLNNLIAQKNQAQFQNSMSQLESHRTNLRSWGIKSYVDFGGEIEEKVGAFESIYQSIVTKNNEIEQLKESVNSLIEPGVAGSLSKAFSDRKDKLTTNKWIWLGLTIITGIVAICTTFNIVNSIVELYNPSFPENATPEQISEILSREIPKTTIAILRIGILIPTYGIFIYFFRHYNKERNLEEEYAHRAAVASSLPNYGNLAGDPSVKDQIVSSASNVVFTSPIEKKIQ